MKSNHFKHKRLLIAFGVVLACLLLSWGIAYSFHVKDNPNCPPIHINKQASVSSSSSQIESAYTWQSFGEARLYMGRGEIEAIDLSPDGTKLVVGSSIGIEAFDPATADRLWHTASVKVDDILRFSPTGEYIAVHGFARITLLDARDGTRLVAFAQPEWECDITRPHWSPSGEELIFGGGRKVYIWDVKTGQITDTIRFWRTVTAVLFSPGGERIAVGFNGGRVAVYDLQAGKTIIRLNPARLGATEGQDGNTLTGPSLLFAIDVEVEDLAYTVDNRYLISDMEVLVVSDPIHKQLVWDLKTGKILSNPDMDDIWADTFDSPITVTRESTNLLVRDTDTGQTIQTLTAQDSYLWGYVWNSQGQSRVAAVTRSDNTSSVVVWNVGEAEPIQRIGDFYRGYGPLSWRSDGVLATGAGPNTVIAWDVKAGEPLDIWKISMDSEDFLLTGDLTRYVLLPDCDSLQLRDVEDGEVIKSAALDCEDYTHISANLDGTMIALDTGEPSVVLIDLQGEPEVHELHDLPDRVIGIIGIVLSPDGRFLAVTHPDGSITLWDTGTRQLLHTLTGHDEAAWEMAFSDDGSQLAAYAHIPTLAINIWDTQSGQLVQTLTIPNTVDAIDFHPSGHYLAVGDFDGQIMFWDIEAGKLVQTFTTDKSLDLSSHLDWSPDGSQIAAASDHGGGIVIFEVELN